MGTRPERAVLRCAILAVWSTSIHSRFQGFTVVARPPRVAKHTAQPGHAPAAFLCPTTTRTAKAPQQSSDGPPRYPGHHHSSTSTSASKSDTSEGARWARIVVELAPVASADARREVRRGGWGTVSSRRRHRTTTFPPLFAEDQSWLDALKEVTGDSGLPMGPKKVRTGAPTLSLHGRP